jgi:hypothetical protein
MEFPELHTLYNHNGHSPSIPFLSQFKSENSKFYITSPENNNLNSEHFRGNHLKRGYCLNKNSEKNYGDSFVSGISPFSTSLHSKSKSAGVYEISNQQEIHEKSLSRASPNFKSNNNKYSSFRTSSPILIKQIFPNLIDQNEKVYLIISF